MPPPYSTSSGASAGCCQSRRAPPQGPEQPSLATQLERLIGAARNLGSAVAIILECRFAAIYIPACECRRAVLRQKALVLPARQVRGPDRHEPGSVQP